jgi:hypothetical protein
VDTIISSTQKLHPVRATRVIRATFGQQLRKCPWSTLSVPIKRACRAHHTQMLRASHANVARNGMLLLARTVWKVVPKNKLFRDRLIRDIFVAAIGKLIWKLLQAAQQMYYIHGNETPGRRRDWSAGFGWFTREVRTPTEYKTSWLFHVILLVNNLMETWHWFSKQNRKIISTVTLKNLRHVLMWFERTPGQFCTKKAGHSRLLRRS